MPDVRYSTITNFYPRSPCGERPAPVVLRLFLIEISIHALLAESDLANLRGLYSEAIFLSTLSLRRATNCVLKLIRLGINFYPRSPCGERHGGGHPQHQHKQISIHALLAESDQSRGSASIPRYLFLSTLSLRRATVVWSAIPTIVDNFYPRSPCGERHPKGHITALPFQFLSTLSLRRATGTDGQNAVILGISIHALLAESDPLSFASCFTALLFLSTLSLRRATVGRCPYAPLVRHFYPRSPCGERPCCSSRWRNSTGISIHALLAESD